MALPSYARRLSFAGQQDQMTPEEAGFYASGDLLPGWNEGRRAVLCWDRLYPNGIAEDQAQISFEFVNTTAGAVDNTWTTGDYTTLETAIDAWWTSIKTKIHGTHKLVMIKWYAFGPSLPMSDKDNELAGPPRRIVARSSLGASAANLPLPNQVAASVTFKTALRRHWGRIYVPAPEPASLDSSGRWTTTFMTALASATDALFDTASAADFLPVVYSVKRRRTHSIEAVQVDDVPDVIRRRRAKRTGLRTIYNS